MKNKKGFVLSFLLVLFIFGVTIPLFMTNHKKIKAETISDLTNTTWTFNDSLEFSFLGSYNQTRTFYLDYTLGGDTFTSIMFGSSNGSFYNIFQVGYETYMDGWMSGSPVTITITGGSNATNSGLISWFQANATQQATGTQITHKYWSPYGVITMQNDEVIGDDDIEYTILYNEYTNTIYETPSTGLVFYGIDTDSGDEYYSAIISYTGGGMNILYAHDNSNNINNAMWLEFTYGDYIDTDLYNFMTTWGLWFDDAEADAYIVGINQGFAEGTIHGRALGQADGIQYTGLVTSIFNGLGGLLSIQVFPNITIGLLIGLPLLLGALIIILKILRG